MNLDVTIERINNGYIITNNQTRTYCQNLEKFVEQYIMEELKERDMSIREHELPDELFTFKLSGNL